ncbi:hypothetical protein [Niallia nealsonii]|uniref:Uncharacterized protein n=1 Tax=Niallia nealsonii TaxID=115979 RepID=A0A2N0Z1I3_9BACI|nr:hypothetical protein [Niallia nealsonii]PKG23370.1 hypothetical protein CWS01_12190 [Niallia nealsonii]
MIYTSGIVDFYYRTTKSPTYKQYITNKINKIKNPYGDKFKVLAISEPFEKNNQIYVRISCSFQIYMQESYYRKSLEDYVGQVFPTLKERLSSDVISTKVHNLAKAHDIKEKKRKKHV